MLDYLDLGDCKADISITPPIIVPVDTPTSEEINQLNEKIESADFTDYGNGKNDGGGNEKSKSNAGMIAGIAVGSAVVVGGAVTRTIFFLRKKQLLIWRIMVILKITHKVNGYINHHYINHD